MRRLTHPIELAAIVAGSIITALVAVAVFAFAAASVAGIIQF